MSGASQHASSKELKRELLGNEAVPPDLSGLSPVRAAVLPLRSARVMSIVCCALIIVATFLPRGMQLDRLVTVDEPLLLGWSANLFQAVGHGNLEDIANAYGYTYPGVTVVWLGALGFLIGDPSYAWEVDEQLEIPNSDIVPMLEERGKEPLDILVRARTIEIVANALVLALAFIIAIRIIGLAIALFGFLLIAFDPFNIAHTRLLNVNGLDGNLMLLSLLAFIAYLDYGKRRRDLALSGMAAAFACLTKLPAIFIVPFVALIVAIRVIQRWRTSGAVRMREVFDEGKPLAYWGAIGALTFIALWPAMWVHPIRTLKIFETMFFTGSEGHDG
jgi:4-amino-4-deoxy-L-arabinose transferase-like glycosyltransferase